MTWYVTVNGNRERVEKAYITVGGERQLVEKLYVVDSGERRLVFPDAINKIWSETLSATETPGISRLRTLTKSEAATLSESWSREAEDRGNNRIWSEGLSATETPAITMARTLTKSEAASLSESWNRNSNNRDTTKTWSEGLSATEITSISKTQVFTKSESASLSENWNRDIETTGPSDLSVTFLSGDCDWDLSWTADSDNSQDIYVCRGSSCDPENDGTLVDTVSAGVNSYTEDATGYEVDDWTWQIKSTAGSSNQDTVQRGQCI